MIVQGTKTPSLYFNFVNFGVTKFRGKLSTFEPNNLKLITWPPTFFNDRMFALLKSLLYKSSYSI